MSTKQRTVMFTYISPKTGRIYAVHDDGTTDHKVFPGRKWKPVYAKKESVSIEKWKEGKYAVYAALPEWARDVKNFPSTKQMEAWTFDGVAESVSGYTVEPDGEGPDGSPSWLKILLGL